MGLGLELIERKLSRSVLRGGGGGDACPLTRLRGRVFVEWYETEEIIIKYIQPGKPMQNAYIERLNRTYREDVLDAYVFDTLEQVRILSDEWQDHYNNHRPHTALKGKTPGMAKTWARRDIPFQR